MNEDELYSYDICTKLVKLHKELKQGSEPGEECYLWNTDLYNLLNDLERVMDKFEQDMKGTPIAIS